MTNTVSVKFEQREHKSQVWTFLVLFVGKLYYWKTVLFWEHENEEINSDSKLLKMQFMLSSSFFPFIKKKNVFQDSSWSRFHQKCVTS